MSPALIGSSAPLSNGEVEWESQRRCFCLHLHRKPTLHSPTSPLKHAAPVSCANHVYGNGVISESTNVCHPISTPFAVTSGSTTVVLEGNPASAGAEQTASSGASSSSSVSRQNGTGTSAAGSGSGGASTCRMPVRQCPRPETMDSKSEQKPQPLRVGPDAATKSSLCGASSSLLPPGASSRTHR